MIKLGNKLKETKREDVPRKFRFIIPEDSSFPMEIPFRYIRKLLLCLTLVMPSFEAQVIIMMMVNFVFMAYYMCFTPSKSKLTNYLNFSVEIGYILIEALFYAYFKLETKNTDSQNGFSIALICVEALIILTSFIWLLYKFLTAFRSSEIWKLIYFKLTENTDPEYLREQQRKRDLEFDFGSLENKSQFEMGMKDEISSQNLNIKTSQNIKNLDKEIYFNNDNKNEKKMKKNQINEKVKDKKYVSTESELSLSLGEKNISEKKSLYEKEIEKKSTSKVQYNETKKTRIKSPFAEKKNVFLQIDSEHENENEIEEIVMNKKDKDIIESNKKEENNVWDDMSFDENEI